MTTARKIEIPFLRTPHNYDRNLAGDESAIHCTDPSLTRQSFAEEADINTIVNRFLKTGELPRDIPAPTYADFNQVYDFKTAMDAVAKAGEAFDAMPAAVRYRFKNDPQQFVEFCSKEENRAEAEKLGLVVPRPLQPSEATQTQTDQKGAFQATPEPAARAAAPTAPKPQDTKATPPGGSPRRDD